MINDVPKLITHWKSSALRNLDDAHAMLLSKRYTGSLFFCHLALEKMLKALIVKQANDHAPYSHNLPYLATLTGLSLSEEQINKISEINPFGVEARYEEEEEALFERADLVYTQNYYDITNELLQWLQQHLKN